MVAYLKEFAPSANKDPKPDILEAMAAFSIDTHCHHQIACGYIESNYRECNEFPKLDILNIVVIQLAAIPQDIEIRFDVRGDNALESNHILYENTFVVIEDYNDDKLDFFHKLVCHKNFAPSLNKNPKQEGHEAIRAFAMEIHSNHHMGYDEIERRTQNATNFKSLILFVPW